MSRLSIETQENYLYSIVGIRKTYKGELYYYGICLYFLWRERKTAQMFHSYLKQHGIDCWMVPIDIPEGANFGSEFKKRIQNCSLLFLILSKSAQLSIYTDNELEQAINFNKPILAVKVEKMDMNSDFIFYLLDHQTIFIDEFEEVTSFDEIPKQMEMLLREIKKFIS